MNTPLTPLEPVLRSFQVHAGRQALADPAGGAALSYAWLADRAARLATALSGLGVGAGGHVLLVSPNTADALCAFHATLLLGAVIVPLNPAFSDESLHFLAGHADPAAALVDLAHLGRLRQRLEDLRVPTLAVGEGADLEGQLRGFSPAPLALPPVLHEDAVVSINYTSGTTSDPKGVMLTHRNAYLNLSNVLYHLNLRPGDRFLHAMSLSHGNGWGAAWAVTAAGATHLPCPDPAGLRAALLGGEVTHLFASPALLTPLTDSAAPLHLPRPVRVLLAGTSPPPRLLAALEAQGFDLLHGYGLTETSAVLTVNEASAAPGDARRLARQGVPMLHGGQVRVVAEDGADVPADGFTPGEIVIRSNQVMKGYYKNPRATRKVIKDGWLHTGDLAVRHPEGDLEILDREGDLLGLSGGAMSSVQIEAVLYRHPSVREAVVVASGAAPEVTAVAFVTLHPGAQVLPRELLSFCAPHLPAHALPRRLHIVAELPKTASGKVLKHVLRARTRKRPEAVPT